MKKEIKFRVWNGEQMVSPDYIDRNGVAHWKENSIPQASGDLMQFTGLLDRRGKEIYEGDIYQYPIAVGYHEDTDEYEFGAALSVVEYSTFAGRPAIGYRFHAFSKDCEVVGNIYENPELIKQ